MTTHCPARTPLVFCALLAFVLIFPAEELAYAHLAGDDGEASVLAEARAILEQITESSMDDTDTAWAIYRWARSHISYIGDSDKSDWLSGAHQAFTFGCGDCFVYFAACKALLAAAGIENLDIVKSDTSHSRHYWNLVKVNGGWYHFDATPRVGEGDNFFLLTDAELAAYSDSHGGSHVFDPSLYPERAVKSVQDMVDYDSAVLKDR